MQKINKKTILFSMILIFLLCLSTVSAEDLNDKNITSSHDAGESINYNADSDMTSVEDNNVDGVLCSTSSSKNTNLHIKENKGKVKDSEEELLRYNLNEYENYTHHIDPNNFESYFDDNGILKDEFNDSILVFNGEFVDKGIITINLPNIQLVGNNTLFKNTVFCLDSTNILITGFNFILDQEFYYNDYSGILVLNDNNTIYNCTMSYTVPDDCSGFCVYCEGCDGGKINGFKLINNTFNFIGNNLNDGWDYCVFLDYVDNAIIYNNTITGLLPLLNVEWPYSQDDMCARMDKVGAFVADNCENLTLLNNYITTTIRSINDEFPTLDTVLIFACNNSVIENNFIYSEDFCTPEGTANYLYGLDLYFSSDVKIIRNQIHIRTTGGTENMSAAYPIQIAGPANVMIAYNNISSVNNGPNLGIYAHNFYGYTKIDIISNFINITGRASTDNWALVSGIEVQDSDDLIWNNTIIAVNLGDYGDKNNIYGISYIQDTPNAHTYNIQYNNIITNGNYAVFLSGQFSTVDDSIVANNVLNTLINSGDDAVHIGEGENNQIFGNTGDESTNTLNNNDLPDWLKNHETLTVPQPKITIPKHSDDKENIIPNPPIINPEHTDENSNGSGTTDNKGNGTMPWNKPGNNAGLNTEDTSQNKETPINSAPIIYNQINNLKETPQSNTENQNTNKNDTTEHNSENTKQNSDSSMNPSKHIGLKIGRNPKPNKAPTSPSDTGSSAANSKTYEVKEKAKKIINNTNSLPATIVSCLLLLLIFIGYKHKTKEEDY